MSPVLPLNPTPDPGWVYELRCYRTHVGRAKEWLDHFTAVMPTREKHMHRVGLWQTEIAQLNEVVHMWAFRDLKERAEARGRLAKEPAWQDFLAKSISCLAHMQAIVLTPAPFSAMR